MKHRDRVLMALHHEKPDRCPMRISFTPEFAARLRAAVGDLRARRHNPHGGGNTYELERALDQDMLLTSDSTRRSPNTRWRTPPRSGATNRRILTGLACTPSPTVCSALSGTSTGSSASR